MAGDIPFNNARGEASTLQMAPPFAFSDVKMTVFPLQANLARLTQFCEGYLNQADHIAQFKPFLPFVYLIILDYGRMSAPATQTGWVSQREVAFGVPLRWLEPDENGEMAFKDFAFTTPFIFVDNELSLSTGREVYGWPKLLARLDPRIDEWIKDPHGARRVFEIRSRAAADHDGDDQRAPFLSVTQTPLTGLFDFPPNLKSATQATAAWPNAAVGTLRLLRDAGVTLGGLLARRAEKADTLSDLFDLDAVRKVFAADDPQRWLSPRNWADVGSVLRGAFPKLYSNTINLKQFRDAENPMQTCYQAITAAKMPIVRFGGGGFLGTQNLLMGQLDGGYRVNIINTATVPVVSQLGLVEAEQIAVDGGLLSSFAPVCPFWIEIDMIYDLGTTLAMRTRSGDWLRPDEAHGGMIEASKRATPWQRARHAVEARAATAEASESNPSVSGPEIVDLTKNLNPDELFTPENLLQMEASNPFNTTRGASEAVGGVFRFKGSQFRVLPLLADPKILNAFIRDYIQVPGHMSVEAWGRHVYLISTHNDDVSADLIPGRKGKSCNVGFSVPVKLYDWGDYNGGLISTVSTMTEEEASRYQKGAARLVGTALVTPFSYSDNISAAISASEILGVPTLRSEIVSPPEGWAAAKENEGILLQARAIVVPSLGTGSEGTRKTLVEVRSGTTIDAAATKRVKDKEIEQAWREMSSTWGNHLAEDLQTKVEERDSDAFSDNTLPNFEWGRAMALRVLGGLHGIDTIGLKQFRDATKPDQACYQGVVIRNTRIERLHALEEIDDDLTVSITRYPTQPIAERLGLIAKRTIVTDEGVCDQFEPIRPFELHADLISSGGRTLFERAGSADWELINLPEGPLGWRPASESEIDNAYREVKRARERSAKVSYVRHDQDTAKPLRMKSLLSDADGKETFLADAKKGNMRDPLLLWRGVELGTLALPEVLHAMDNGAIDDIHSFVRTRQPAIDENGQTIDAPPVSELAGALELVSPATILDSILSRNWGSRKSHWSGAAIQVPDFRLRRNTLGPHLAEFLFPERESQDGYWPCSEEQSVSARFRDALLEDSLPHQFRRFVQLFSMEKTAFSEHVEDVGQRTLPAWFYAAAFERTPLLDQMVTEDLLPESLPGVDLSNVTAAIDSMKCAAALMGAWPLHFKIELQEGVAAFFDEIISLLDPDDFMVGELTFFARIWHRLTAELIAKAAPDGYDPSTEYTLDDLDYVIKHRGTSPTPGWLHVRLRLLAENDDLTMDDLKEQAHRWEREYSLAMRTTPSSNPN